MTVLEIDLSCTKVIKVGSFDYTNDWGYAINKGRYGRVDILVELVLDVESMTTEHLNAFNHKEDMKEDLREL